MLKEFREFALKGSLLDMAVGIIIGGAFGTIIQSLVKDILMPIIAAIFNTPDFSNVGIVLKNPDKLAFTNLQEYIDAGLPVLSYGNFLNALISFLIIAFTMFMIIRSMNNIKRKAEEEEAAAPPAPSAQEVLLGEIRDLLANK